MPANGEVLDLLQEKINTALQAKRIRSADKTMLEIMQLFVIYMQDDHPKTQTMWRVFQPALWVGTLLATAFIGLIAAGRVQVFIK